MSSSIRIAINSDALTRLAQAIAVVLSATLAGCQTTSHIEPVSSHRAPNLAGEFKQKPIFLTGKPTPLAPQDVWERMRQGFQLQEGNGQNPRIDQQRLWFANNPAFIEAAGERGSLYMHYIVERLEERNMPLELALLPVIESAYNPMAYSRSDAVGLWQFIPSTGRYFNLRQTSFYDGRRDITASTIAALDYLTRLHDMFNGDWLLALAAYNAGEGTVSRAIERNQKLGLPTDYWNLSLPQETQDYVPKFLALSQVVMAPEAYGVNLSPIANEPYFKVVELNHTMDLSKVAAMADIDEDELFQLNPAFKKRMTIDGPQHLLVPTAKAQLLTANLSNMKPEELVDWQQYKVRRGDTLVSLASRYRVSVNTLKDVNKLSAKGVHAGQTLSIPTIPGMTPAGPAFEEMASRDIPSASRSYQVKKGDSLATIAKAHKVEVKELQHWNGLSGQHLKIGQTLVMQDANKKSRSKSTAVASTKSKASEKATTQYTIRKGDSMYLVAKRFNVEMQHLKRWNPRSGMALKPGETLTVYRND
ncbi:MULTISPECIES: LysM peptidoglycan-binding domain-containing protein [unclassified Pseudomonas]|uniref:LysM peptidoglycan-binding domain-containing protein n=1 Tax=unclassified Pseudomonas TaxID=196821 RepID=UPI002AC8F219|nr:MULTISPECIES: LysM peptidoglycan-binding domain-containing protein [unclassified Pseudomonas]MEB0042182.1 LysM peptidoglycan-binding domain-containing protein [Pseudomonas sp. MH10]MEB0077512.1 LysM peptidoglycan-binding domain-containing protein [Pseudomonas sp. MH10out]MEB0090270.1 LysM peptidoglycan-binding domain-containing protein [Pseudomonas sp. CCI4.2]MEB0102581.1 LysM peptidoglycan-binding domain-containing protein [Pseudomonas sp. CCI3.2]MEB0119365.1 LysM peptidoglycan-binding dom